VKVNPKGYSVTRSDARSPHFAGDRLMMSRFDAGLGLV
jgi:hypothetical protein